MTHNGKSGQYCVQVALYDDRLEVTLPGNLCYGLTLEEAMSGRSKQRNRVIAEVFNQMGLIEAWGTGLGKIQRAAREYHLPEPEFIEMPETFRVNLFRNPPLKKNLYYTETHSDELQENFGETSEELRRNFRRTSEKLRRNFRRTSEKLRKNFGVIQRRNLARRRKKYWSFYQLMSNFQPESLRIKSVFQDEV